jgi:RNA polymerase sigma-70 factor, ECF subfamily
MKRVTDVELTEAFMKGDIAAFEELVSRYESKVMNLALRFVRNQEDAEEVMQDVFTTLYRKVQSFQGKSQFSSWLYRIVVNAAFMKLRKRKQSQTVSIEDLAPAVREFCIEREALSISTSTNMLVSRELREVLQDAIDKLPEQYRAVFILRDVDGLSNHETGEILNLSIPAIKSRLHRSRLMLRRKLQRYYDDFNGGMTKAPISHDVSNEDYEDLFAAA